MTSERRICLDWWLGKRGEKRRRQRLCRGTENK